MKAEVPGPTFGKLVSKTDITAKILYKIYICMTLVLIVILKLAGMSWFDAFIHAFGTIDQGSCRSCVPIVKFDENEDTKKDDSEKTNTKV